MKDGAWSHNVAGAIVDLRDARSGDPAVSGAKGAALARAAATGLPVLAGFVLTTEWVADAPGRAAAVRWWRELSDDGARAVIVRSSSTAEDLAESSMAGRFTSTVDVSSADQFLEGVDQVRASARVVSLDGPGDTSESPMAVLVQLQLDAEVGGVLFGADPVSGARDRLVVAAAAGPPHGLVQGTVEGSRYTLSPRGRVKGVDHGDGAVQLTRRQRLALADLAAKAAALFAGPQDIEWGIDASDRCWLFQSRPITTLSPPAETLERWQLGWLRRRRRIYGPGPVAETLPNALSRLEADLWAIPLNEGVADALELAGLAGARELRHHPPVIVTASGHVAADLRLLHAAPRHRLAVLDPRPAMRRVRAAWRVGRLRAALAGLAEDVVERTDELLGEVPPLPTLRDGELIGLLRTSRRALASVHGHEVLVGLLVAPAAGSVSGAAMALRALATGRAEGLSDDDIVARYPVTLALLTPAIGTPMQLPPTPDADLSAVADADRAAVAREALRLRARWLQELGARVSIELGRRLSERSVLGDPLDVRDLSLDELALAVRTGQISGVTPARTHTPARGRPARLGGAAPLPAVFRLRADGTVEPVSTPAARSGTGAGGGRGEGPVHQSGGLPPVGSVLVVRSLDPSLAPLLPRLAGLVSETGSPLSHLAILARELHVPTVVGVTGAIDRFPPGTVVTVDGTTGEVDAIDRQGVS